MTPNCSTLEALLLADREECVKRVAGLAWGAAYGLKEIGKVLLEVEQAIQAGDGKKAELKLGLAKQQVLFWHTTYDDTLTPLRGYLERGSDTLQ